MWQARENCHFHTSKILAAWYFNFMMLNCFTEPMEDAVKIYVALYKLDEDEYSIFGVTKSMNYKASITKYQPLSAIGNLPCTTKLICSSFGTYLQNKI